MLTPQDLQEVYFDKARFGGYSMQSVDAFLEPLMNDYLTLYKENAVLKSKMRLLVERLEAYRAKEGEMKQALDNAQKTCDEMIANAQKQCADMMANASAGARTKSRENESAVNFELERLNQAKADTRSFIETVERELAAQQAALNRLKALGLEPTPIPEAPKKPYDFDQEADDPVPQPVSAPVPELPDLSVPAVPELQISPDAPEAPVFPAAPVVPEAAPAAPVVPEAPVFPAAPVAADDIASEIEQNVEKIMEDVPAAPDELAKTKIMPAIDFAREDKYADLQFGKNYNPTK